MCFHSLQTGKRIASLFLKCIQVCDFFQFPFPSNGKAHRKCCPATHTAMWHAKGFHSLQTGKRIARDPILSPMGPWVQKPKNIRELHGAIFKRDFSPKLPQTRVYTEPYAIFLSKRLRSQAVTGFLGNFHRVVHNSRIAFSVVIKYTRKLETCQTFSNVS